MVVITAAGLDHRALNDRIRAGGNACRVTGCLGQRFLGAGMSGQEITVEGIPGNALGAYLDGARITVNGNAQDAVGDTMDSGTIVVHGNVGDAAGYAMRGGRLFVRGSAGYRAGIHMKAYRGKIPVMVIGGSAGSFLGEYQAGGVIVVLGLETAGRAVGNFPCTGMHGGKVFLRGPWDEIEFPSQVVVREAAGPDLRELEGYVAEYCALFGGDPDRVMDAPFAVVTPDSKNPYRQMYVAN